MSCQHCAGTVEKALRELEGVQSVSVDLQNKRAMIEFSESEVNMARIKEAVKECGYDPV